MFIIKDITNNTDKHRVMDGKRSFQAFFKRATDQHWRVFSCHSPNPVSVETIMYEWLVIGAQFNLQLFGPPWRLGVRLKVPASKSCSIFLFLMTSPLLETNEAPPANLINIMTLLPLQRVRRF
jgi:hypothetical protein